MSSFNDNPNAEAIGRVEEQDLISNFLSSWNNRTSLYLCGLPGTGKTFICRRVADNFTSSKIIYINCMEHDSIIKFIQYLLDQFKVDSLSVIREIKPKIARNSTIAGQILINFLKDEKLQDFILILDEIDHIVKKSPFWLKWLHCDLSQLIKVISISNTLSLIIPRGNSSVFSNKSISREFSVVYDIPRNSQDYSIIVLEFTPYSHNELKMILTDRQNQENKLREEETIYGTPRKITIKKPIKDRLIATCHKSENLISKPLSPIVNVKLDFISRKAASSTGDCRQALSLAKNMINIDKISEVSNKINEISENRDSFNFIEKMSITETSAMILLVFLKLKIFINSAKSQTELIKIIISEVKRLISVELKDKTRILEGVDGLVCLSIVSTRSSKGRGRFCFRYFIAEEKYGVLVNLLSEYSPIYRNILVGGVDIRE